MLNTILSIVRDGNWRRWHCTLFAFTFIKESPICVDRQYRQYRPLSDKRKGPQYKLIALKHGACMYTTILFYQRVADNVNVLKDEWRVYTWPLSYKRKGWQYRWSTVKNVERILDHSHSLFWRGTSEKTHPVYKCSEEWRGCTLDHFLRKENITFWFCFYSKKGSKYKCSEEWRIYTGPLFGFLSP